MRTWKGPVAAIVGITVVIELLLVVSRSGPAVLLIAALCGLVGVVFWFIVDLAEVTLDSSESDVEPSGPQFVGRTDRRVMRLRSGLAYTRDDETLERLPRRVSSSWSTTSSRLCTTSTVPPIPSGCQRGTRA